MAVNENNHNHTTIIQWNPNGINSKKKTEIKQLITEFNPICLGMQETRFKTSQNIQLKNYKIF